MALGSISGRTEFLAHLRDLPMIGTITPRRDSRVSSRVRLWFGRGIGLVDAHLPGAARLVPGTSVWTRIVVSRLRQDPVRPMAVADRGLRLHPALAVADATGKCGSRAAAIDDVIALPRDGGWQGVLTGRSHTG